MDSVRGQNKTLGEFRKDQNWTGAHGCKIEQATFVPPNPLQLNDYLQLWEAYLKVDDIDPIFQTAIAHAQFELIHPFKDGNGRICRLLIQLYLYSKDRLSSPMFYLSQYFEQHRDEYYARSQHSELTRSPHSAQLVDALFDKPIFTTADIFKRANIPKPTVHKLINLLEEGVLDTVRAGVGRRAVILTFAELLNTLERKQLV